MIIKEMLLGKHNPNKTLRAQAILETTLALTVLFIFLFGSLKIFVWLNKNLVNYQKNFQETRWVDVYRLNKDAQVLANSGKGDDTALAYIDTGGYIFPVDGDGDLIIQGLYLDKGYATALNDAGKEKLKIFE